MDKSCSSLSINTVYKTLNSGRNGLSSEEAKKRLSEFGFNELEENKENKVLKILLNQLRNALLWLLIFACLLSLFLKEYLDAFAMLGIILLNVLLGFVQEYRAEKASLALKKLSSPLSMVVRDGTEGKIPSREIVKGDIIVLEAGDIVPADSRIIELSSLQVDEASLTGESVPVKKNLSTQLNAVEITDQLNMVFTGTVVTYGKCVAIAVNTGMNTEFGKIAKSLSETKETVTPLQHKFAVMAKQIGLAVICLIAFIAVLALIKGEATFFEIIIFCLSLTVAAVPNALPVIVTVGLSLGSRNLSKKNMLIKKLPAAETLGSVTVICTDKTGTLTKNEMTVKKIFVNNSYVDVTGSGYSLSGRLYLDNSLLDLKKVDLLAKSIFLCNNSKVTKNDKGEYSILGDPTEGALKVLGYKMGVTDNITDTMKFIEELPFDSDRKCMSVIYKNLENYRTESFVKGAPDLLIQKCSKILVNGKVILLTEKQKSLILEKNKEMSLDSLRVLGVSYRDVTNVKKYSIDTIESDMVFIGLVGMIDPPRDGVQESIKQCKEAGISVIMITGDHPGTAKAIAREIGLFNEGDLLITGADVDAMSESELSSKIVSVRIIARALPIQKLRIVRALKNNGHIVAMTGDGVNDAPALKSADIGISMGITGTDVSKEVSGAILVDDHFSTIVNGIEEGRNIYDKMIKSVRYLLSCNMGEIVSVFLAVLLNFPLPLIPLQILLMNLLTDDFPALGLGMETSEKHTMKRPPRNPSDKPIDKHMLILIFIFGLLMGLGTLIMFKIHLPENFSILSSSEDEMALSYPRTIAFTTLVMFEMFAVIASRSLYSDYTKFNPLTNRWLTLAIIGSILIQCSVIYLAPLQIIFRTSPISLLDWGAIIMVSFTGFLIMELSKLVFKKYNWI